MTENDLQNFRDFTLRLFNRIRAAILNRHVSLKTLFCFYRTNSA